MSADEPHAPELQHLGKRDNNEAALVEAPLKVQKLAEDHQVAPAEPPPEQQPNTNEQLAIINCELLHYSQEELIENKETPSNEPEPATEVPESESTNDEPELSNTSVSTSNRIEVIEETITIKELQGPQVDVAVLLATLNELTQKVDQLHEEVIQYVPFPSILLMILLMNAKIRNLLQNRRSIKMKFPIKLTSIGCSMKLIS
jgi:hypothetical protein